MVNKHVIRTALNLVLRSTKSVAIIVKQSKENSWKEFGQKLDTDYPSANKVFWQIIRCLHGKRTPVATFIKDTNGVLLKHQKGILSSWREYFCKVLNPVIVQHLEIFKKQTAEEIHFTETEVSTAIKSLYTGKAPG